jgi:WXG100 family type VII secretion target
VRRAQKEGWDVAANLNVTYDEMRTAARQLRSGQTDIEGKLEELARLVAGLVSGGYVTDRSSKAFDAAYTEFNDGVRKTVAGLEGMSSYLEQAAQAMEDTDSQLASSLGR